ncbi:hypothetical protein BU25DRAFT_410641 [Macroventuria anomochaeta]|uniref:Uncharacterized protein n=1 Tax=Macroventuria anomochaeta TaxID=301207 RepID=A0ACB6S3B7_9PLEO|nr:uncharacterized protein BU25DRAFT_410641 [Macroventuria anomochaeta]KAF2628017.1 hypothetical protein BU25DRAFT_410641 [Macroventuria anomochaeta]
MSHLSIGFEDTTELPSRYPLTNVLSLPYELLQSILSSIANFEPWTYSSNTRCADATITDKDVLLSTRDLTPLNLASINRHILGLSSTNDWLMLTLSRHPYRLSQSDKGGILSAITQALRRMNARLERMHWAGRKSNASPQILGDREIASSKNLDTASVQDAPVYDDSFDQTPSDIPMKQYFASVQSEEESYTNEYILTRPMCAARPFNGTSSSTSAVVVYDPTPILKLSNLDIAQRVRQSELPRATEQFAALLVAVLITLAPRRLSLLENLEKLERDTPIPTIEPCECRDFATSKTSFRTDRPRSLSGSTVAELLPHEETLSFSTISTVYSSDRNHDVRSAEKRESEEKDVGTSPKRPKLSEYKQVSSGRVATLMDRFEKFHL